LVDSMDTFNLNLNQLLMGFYTGAIGETFTLLIVFLGIYLAFIKVHNWRPTIFFYGSIFLTTLAMGVVSGINPLMFSLIFLSSGSIAFGGSFMLTDPVSSPTSNFGKALIGVIAGLLVVLIRFQTNNPEAVAYAIALVNIISPAIDKFAVGMIHQNLLGKWGMLASVSAASMFLNGGLAYAQVNPTVSSSSDTSSETITYARSFVGVATTDNCAATDEDCLTPESDTIEVEIFVDEAYRIGKIEVGGKTATAGFWRNRFNERLPAILQAYGAYSIKGIQQLSALPPLAEDIAITGATQSASRLLLALQDAVKHIDVYAGSATSDIPEDPEATLYTMNVLVYVEDGMIMAIDILNPEDIATSGFYRRIWNEGYDALIALYTSLSVTEFLALESYPVNFMIAGATVSTERLMDAVRHALLSNGGGV